MAKFLLLSRDAGIDPSLGPGQIRQIMQPYQVWSRKLSEAGRLKSGGKLRDKEGRVLKRESGNIAVSDGPYREAKQVLGGYWIIEAADYAEAELLISDHPHLNRGTLELRQIEDHPPPRS